MLTAEERNLVKQAQIQFDIASRFGDGYTLSLFYLWSETDRTIQGLRRLMDNLMKRA